MARNYAALPHEYLEEMDILSDAEFGRLCRALLQYSMDGKEGQLEGAEKVLWKRVKRQEDRFKESYEEQTNSKRSAGKKGAEKRWRGMASDGTSIAKDSCAIVGMASDGKNAYTETKTETKTETNTPPPDGGRSTRDPAIAAVMSAYLNKINPQISETTRNELAGFAAVMGEGCCLRAIDIALDAKKAAWPYIRAILQTKQSQGVRCLADWDAVESRRKPSAQKKPAKGPLTDIPPVDPAKAREDIAQMEKYLAELRKEDGGT